MTLTDTDTDTDNMQTVKVVVIGASNRDIISRFADEVAHLADSNQGIILQHDGGVGRNIADALGCFHVPTTLITALGDDETSRAMVARLMQKNVDMSHAHIQENTSTDMFISVHDHKGELVTALNQMAVIAAITPAFIHAKKDIIATADFIICDCNLPADTLAEIAHLPRRGTFVIEAVSTQKVKRIIPFLSKIDILKANYLEATTVANAPVGAGADSLPLRLRDCGIGQAIVSDGPRGFYINEADITHHFDAIPTSPQTVSGAGDCLLAGYIFGRANQYSIAQSGQFARRAAFLSTASVSAINDSITLQNILNSDTPMKA